MSESDAIRPYSKNAAYWQYRGEPVLLLGGSNRDNLFHWAGDGPRLTEHLDALVACGGNYLRCTISSREYTPEGYRWDILPYPWLKREDGKYDLDQWDESYWARLQTFLAETQRRSIIVQLEIWDMWNESGNSEKRERGGGWYDSPWNPNNNVTYDWSDSPLLEPGKTDFYNRFFWAPVEHDELLTRHQERFIGRLVDEVLQFDHVLFQIDNESGIAFEVGEYWAKFIAARGQAAGRSLFVCDSRRFHSPTPVVTTTFKDWANPDISVPVGNPEVYTFCDISQNNGNSGQTHYDNLLWYRSKVIEHGVRPINHVKCYHFLWPTGEGFNKRTSPSDAEAGAKFWRVVFGGAASIRFHRDTPTKPGGLREGFGLGPESAAHMRSMRMLADALDLFVMEPHNELLDARVDNQAYCLAAPGKQYAVFFTGQPAGAVELDLSNASGALKQRWLDISASAWRDVAPVQAGTTQTIQPPGQQLWAVVLG